MVLGGFLGFWGVFVCLGCWGCLGFFWVFWGLWGGLYGGLREVLYSVGYGGGKAIMGVMWCWRGGGVFVVVFG